jgi:hypothetical protein
LVGSMVTDIWARAEPGPRSQNPVTTATICSSGAHGFGADMDVGTEEKPGEFTEAVNGLAAAGLGLGQF